MPSSQFQTDAFSSAINYIRELFKNYQNISNLVDICYPDPTLSLNLILITEAIANKKNLTENLGYQQATFSSSLIIAAAISVWKFSSVQFLDPNGLQLQPQPVATTASFSDNQTEQ